MFTTDPFSTTNFLETLACLLIGVPSGITLGLIIAAVIKFLTPPKHYFIYDEDRAQIKYMRDVARDYQGVLTMYLNRGR